MNILDLYLKLLLLVVLPLVTGMAFSGRKWAPKTASTIFALALYLFQTVIAFLAVWKAELINRSWSLPLITFGAWLISLGIAFLPNRFMQHENKQRGSFLFTVCLSNHGYTLLGIVALIVFGEAGLAQATYAQLLYVPFLILICFPIARIFGGERPPESIIHFLTTNLLDKRNLPLLAMLGGLGLNLSGVARPALFSDVVRMAVFIGTLISGFAVGLLFHASKIMTYKKENLFSILYRSTLYPFIYFAAARLFQLNRLDTLILILFGIVPSAVYSNLIADLFNLDKGLTNSVYIISTLLFLVFALPVFLLLTS